MYKNQSTMLALIDIDGVLADDRHRLDYALEKNWDEYFKPSNVEADGVWPKGVELVAWAMNQGYSIEYLTGRWSVLRGVTEQWFDRCTDLPIARLSMREPDWYDTGVLTESPEWPKLSLADFKVQHIRRRLASGRFSEIVLFDDDLAVIEAVQLTFGMEYGVYCGWSQKPEEMVRLAQA